MAEVVNASSEPQNPLKVEGVKKGKVTHRKRKKKVFDDGKSITVILENTGRNDIVLNGLSIASGKRIKILRSVWDAQKESGMANPYLNQGNLLVRSAMLGQKA